MTWFRVGGAGIPAALKNAMNAVFNKKFGTTGQNYPSNQWPDEVNLMGPLPEGTASGSIANIADGADQVPIKLWNCTVDNSDGISSVLCTKAGKNLLLPSNADVAEATVNGIKRSFSIDSQEFTFYGTNTKTDASWLIFNTTSFVFNGLKSGVTYKFSHNLPDVMYAQLTYNKSGGGVGAMGYLKGVVGRNASVSFTVPSDFSSLRQFQIGVSNTATDVDITAHFQIEVGSTATAYEAYETPTQYTVSLGRTIHGGSLEFINGAGTDENDVNFTFDPISPIPETENVCNFWTNVGASSIVYRRDIDLALQALSGNRGLMMSSRAAEPMIGEESDLEQVNELEVEPEITEEQEGENDAR